VKKMSDIFIANTRLKKLKRLFFLSRKIIKEFGMRYFLRICYENLGKQKLDIFSSDKPSSFDFAEFLSDYDVFRKKMITKNNLELEKNISEFSNKPTFTFLLINNATNIEDVRKSFKSILNQVYKSFDLQLVNYSQNTVDILKTQLNSNKSLKEINSDKLDEIIPQIKGDFVVIPDSRTILQSDLLYHVVKEFNQKPDSEIFYTDEICLDENNNVTNLLFKPGWSPYLFASMNYLGRFCIIRKTLLEKVSGLDVTHDNLVYDLLLRCSEITEKF